MDLEAEGRVGSQAQVEPGAQQQWQEGGGTGYLMQKADSLEKTLTLIEGRGRRVQQRMRWLDSITDLTGVNLSKLLEILKDRESWRAAVQSQTQLSDQTTTCITMVSQ